MPVAYYSPCHTRSVYEKSNALEILKLTGIDTRTVRYNTCCGIDFINTEVRKEWEQDIKAVAGDPASGVWLKTLRSRKWRLRILQTVDIKLDEFALNYIDVKSGYNFAERLSQRRNELRKAIELFGRVIWPIVIREEDMEVLDGYCRCTTLREMGVTRAYAYVGGL